MSAKGTNLLLYLLLFTNTGLSLSQETGTVLKIGVILDSGIAVEPLRQAVGKLSEHYGPWLPQTRTALVWASSNSSGSVQVTKTVRSLLNTGVQAFVTVLRCPKLKSVALMAEQLQIPHVAINQRPCRLPDPRRFTIYLTIHQENIHTVLSEIALFAGWKKMTLVFDKVVDNNYRQNIVLELSKNGIVSVLSPSSPISTRSWQHKEVAVVTASDNLPELKCMASDQDALRGHYWLIIFINEVSVNSLNTVFKPCNSSNILLVKVKPRNIAHVSFLSGIPFARSEVSLPPLGFRIFEALALYGSAAQNLSMNRTGRRPEESFVNLSQFGNGSTHLLQQIQRVCCSVEDKPESACIPTEYDLYSIQANSDTVFNVGEWTVRNKLTISDSGLFPIEFADFGNRNVRVGLPYYNSKPFIDLEQDGKSYKGLIIDIVKDLAKTLKFNHTFIEAPDGLFGHRLPNGSWTGAIGMVVRREVEFAAFFTMTPQRYEAVDFTTPFMQDSLGLLTPKPKEVADLFQIFKSFSVGVWMLFVAFVITAIIMFIIIGKLTYPLPCEENTLRKYILMNVLLAASSAFEQGPTFHPKSTSGRCFLAFWFVFSLLMTNIYTADLASVLTVSKPLKPINTLQELVEQSDMKVLVNYGTSTWSLFSESDNPVYREVGKRMEKSVHSIDPVKNGGYSLVSDRSYLEYLALVNCEHIRLAEERFQSISFAFAVPKNSTYKEAMDLSIQKMVEAGMMAKLIRKWWTPSANCSGKPKNTNNVVLDLDRVGGIFIFYLGLCSSAGFVLVGEYILRKCFSPNLRQTPRDAAPR